MLYENVLYVNYTKIIPLILLDIVYSFYTAKCLFYNSYTLLFYLFLYRFVLVCFIRKIKCFLYVKFLDLGSRNVKKNFYRRLYELKHQHLFFVCPTLFFWTDGLSENYGCAKIAKKIFGTTKVTTRLAPIDCKHYSYHSNYLLCIHFLSWKSRMSQHFKI